MKHAEDEVIVKHTEDEVNENVKIEIESANMGRQTVNNLNERIKDLLTKNAMLEFGKEELEIKNESLEKAKIDMDDSIEEVYTRNRELLKLNENLVNESIIMKIEVEEERKETKKEALKISKKTEILEASSKDLEERMMISENVIKSCDL